jgi:AhpD family alkylhydroperoxidase
MSPPRIAPGDFGALGPFNWGFAQIAGRVMRTNPPNLFTTLGRHKGLFRGWLMFAGRLMPGGKLKRRESELVILRVAHLRACEYEWHHHVKLGRRAGIGKAELDRVQAGPGAEGWTPREQAILAAVDELHATQDLSDATWDALRAHLDERESIELVMLAAHYEMLATAIGVLRLETDR